MRTSAGFLEIGLSGKIRIQIRPPRLMWRVIARRAASIWRAVKRPRATAFRPNSPKLTWLPRVAMPVLRPFCSLRYFLLAGCSMLCSRLSYFLFRFSGDRCSCFLTNFAFEHPNLHTDDAVSSLRFRSAVVNIGTQSMQRHTAFAIPLGTGDFNPVQTAGAHDLDALRTQAHRVLHRAFHRAAEHDALFQLRGNAVSDQLRINFRFTDFLDGDIDRLQAHALAQFGAQCLNVLTLFSYHHARACGINSHFGILGRTFDNHLGYPGGSQFLFQERTNLNILEQQISKIFAVG